MAWRDAVLVVGGCCFVVACGGAERGGESQRTSASNSAPDPPIALDRPELYPAPQVQPGQTICTQKPHSSEDNRYGYDFESSPLQVRPIAAGPQIAEQARVGLPRQWLVQVEPDYR